MRILMLLGLILPFGIASAQPIVKSVDKSGHVTYSDRPIEGASSVSEIEPPPEPSPEEVKAAEERLERLIEEDAKLEAERKKAEEARRKEAMERAKSQPKVIVIKEKPNPQPNTYYMYPPRHPGFRPPGQRPPGHHPPGMKPPGHHPPGARPPVTLPSR